MWSLDPAAPRAPQCCALRGVSAIRWHTPRVPVQRAHASTLPSQLLLAETRKSLLPQPPTKQLRRTDGTSMQTLALAHGWKPGTEISSSRDDTRSRHKCPPAHGDRCSQEPGPQAPSAGSAPGSHLQARRPGAEAGPGGKGLAPPLCLRDPVPGPGCGSRTSEGWPLRTGQPPEEGGRAPAPARDIPRLPSAGSPAGSPDRQLQTAAGGGSWPLAAVTGHLLLDM